MGNSNLKVLVLFSGLMAPLGFGLNSPLKWTGVASRFFEVLKRGESYGIDYVVAFEKKGFLQAIKQFPSVLSVLKKHRVYLVDLYPLSANVLNSRRIRRFLEILKFGFVLRNIAKMQSAFVLSQIAREEKVDLLLSTSEADWLCLVAYIAAKISKKPWTAIWQSTEDLLGSTVGVGPLNPLNVLPFISSRDEDRKISKTAKIMKAVTILTELKLAEKTLTLAVSQSLVEQIAPLNAKAEFLTISPGNGVDLRKYQVQPINRSIKRTYSAIFFARLVPSKGLYDLTEIWKIVLRSLPQAKLAVAGITIKSSFIKHFNEIVQNNQLSENIIFVGALAKNELIQLIKSSALTLYPSLLDSFAIVILESLACGVPVVAYDIPAIRENYWRCPAVLRCPVGNKEGMAENVLSILRNEQLRSTLSQKGKECCANFDWNDVVKAEKEAYLKVVEHFKSKKIEIHKKTGRFRLF